MRPYGGLISGRPCGPNIRGPGGCALVEVKLAVLDAGSLHVGSADGPVLHRAALPYALPSDV